MDLLTTLVLGAYGAYAAVGLAYRDLRDRIDRVIGNHLKHIEARLDRLEERDS